MSGHWDEASWRSWLERHGPALRLLARQHCASTEDAEDAVQSGFVRFWKSRHKAADPAAYLFACVRSAAIDSWRSRTRRRNEESELGEERARECFQSVVEQEELRRSVEAALATLPAEQLEVLVLRMWGQLTFAQIAAVLDINLQTAASRYRYALSRLETKLRQEAANG